MASLQELNVTDFAFGTIGSASSPTASLRSASTFRISHEQNKSLCWQPLANLFGLDNTERDALRAIAQTHVLAGKPSPLAGEIEGKIHLVLCHQIEKYK
jgi:hypothetical protein